ncbi:hypothetical protein B0G76_1586 [Paraburkholderia sp. BL23I1N1]|nr:hypothetical protein B0G71_1515 [Paraburkholderia sp. BL27I4N3]RKE35496.1 hypothetical protein B0G76_1586 [Paraburkholderia sp. BL23I1N1]
MATSANTAKRCGSQVVLIVPYAIVAGNGTVLHWIAHMNATVDIGAVARTNVTDAFSNAYPVCCPFNSSSSMLSA